MHRQGSYFGTAEVAVFAPRSPAKKSWAMEALITGFIVQQAQISFLLPGARLTGLSAPDAMLVGRHKHLARPAP